MPTEEIILRYTSAFATKADKYATYIGNCVGKDDVTLIAISGGDLDYRYKETFLPHILQALFPIGNYAVHIDSRTLGIVQEGTSVPRADRQCIHPLFRN